MTGWIDVMRPGLLTTVQDGGRWGWQSRGVSVAGPMDPFAARMANALVGNDRHAAVLEITLAGPSLTFGDTCLVAVSGATFDLFVDEQPVSPKHTFTVAIGSTLRFGGRQHGARAYLSVAGGIDVHPILGSRSTHLPSHLGGIDGRALARGDRLTLGRPTGTPPVHLHPLVGAARTPQQSSIRVLPGPDQAMFARHALEVLQQAPYLVDTESNRTGYRLKGTTVPRVVSDDQLSDLTTFGTIQVPASGQPILLMADRQTTGGYPRIAHVISADLGIAGQAAPGDELRFEVCTADVAHDALMDMERRLMAIEVPQ